ncbi:MAG TPA: 3'-5' exonuclease [Acetobacteraceae bacterium]|nr:3'-5' exonuclease [Acetobacteraceae bacterium]
MFAFVDTETTGFAVGGVQPRIVSMAWIVADCVDQPRAVRGAIVRPEGFTIPRDATRVHGITTARARREGRPLPEVLAAFEADLAGFGVRALVAHNLAYDRPVIEAEYARLGRACPIAALEGLCTMHAARRASPWESASLGAVHARLFGAAVADAHQAEADVAACARIFFALGPEAFAADRRPDPGALARDTAWVAAVRRWACAHPEFDRAEFIESLHGWVAGGRVLTERQREALARTAARWRIALPG